MLNGFRPEGCFLPVTLPSAFETFYRDKLRRIAGSRMRSRALFEEYATWADANDQLTITYSTLKRLMETIGHRRIQSNGVHYEAVALASDFPDVTDTLPNPFRGAVLDFDLKGHRKIESAPLISKVDAALAALLDLRRAIETADDQAAPHVAAQRALGLFDQ